MSKNTKESSFVTHLSELRKRLIRRGRDNSKDINLRLSYALNEISHYNEYSYVLKSMGYKVDRCKNSVRLCVGRQNSERDILKASDNIMKSYEYLLKI